MPPFFFALTQPTVENAGNQPMQARFERLFQLNVVQGKCRDTLKNHRKSRDFKEIMEAVNRGIACT